MLIVTSYFADSILVTKYHGIWKIRLIPRKDDLVKHSGMDTENCRAPLKNSYPELQCCSLLGQGTSPDEGTACQWLGTANDWSCISPPRSILTEPQYPVLSWTQETVQWNRLIRLSFTEEELHRGQLPNAALFSVSIWGNWLIGTWKKEKLHSSVLHFK